VERAPDPGRIRGQLGKLLRVLHKTLGLRVLLLLLNVGKWKGCRCLLVELLRRLRLERLEKHFIF
jgi:hypothetical protein